MSMTFMPSNGDVMKNLLFVQLLSIECQAENQMETVSSAVDNGCPFFLNMDNGFAGKNKICPESGHILFKGVILVVCESAQAFSLAITLPIQTEKTSSNSPSAFSSSRILSAPRAARYSSKSMAAWQKWS